MKVRFDSQKEKDPTRDGGLRVLYAPGKRASFKLRWYLILFTVTAPFLWFIFKLLSGILLVDVPGRLTLPIHDIRALETGIVSNILVQPEDIITSNQVIVQMSNDQLNMQLTQLSETNTVEQPLSLVTRRRDTLLQLVERAEQRVDSYQALVRRGAATIGELRAAEDTRDARLGDLLAFEQSLRPTPAERASTETDQQARQLLQARVNRLTVSATQRGRIQSVEVSEGESLGPGTLIATFQPFEHPDLTIFMPTEHSELARPGQSFRVQLPDNSWHDAVVITEKAELQRIPPDLRSPFGGDRPHLVLKAEFTEPLPERWYRNNVPLTARFPNWIERNWPF